MSYNNSSFRGPGNALYIKDYVDAEFKPLTWNMAAMKCMKIIVQNKINITKIDVNTELPEPVLQALHAALLERSDKGLPIY